LKSDFFFILEIRNKLTVQGDHTIITVAVDSEKSNWEKPYIKVAPTGRELTFSTDTDFKDALDLARPTGGELGGTYTITCRNGPNDTPYTLDGRFNVLINDTNSRTPVFEIENPYFALNLDTWQSKDIINFAETIKVNDMDFEKENAVVTVTSANKVVTVEPYDVNYSGGSGGWNSTFNLYLNPDASYGNYTFELKVTDGTHASAKNITLYIGAGAQFQATTALTVLLVSVATWFNLK